MKWLISLLGVVVLAAGIGLAAHENATSEKVVYSGTVVFDNEADYQAFKVFSLSPGKEIVDVSAMSSPPPIYVKYRLIVPRGEAFPYKYDKKQVDWNRGMLFGSALLTAIGGFGVMMGGAVVTGSRR